MVPADFDARDGQESIVDVVTTLITDSESPVLVQAGKTPLDDPTIDPKAAAVAGLSLGQDGSNALASQRRPMRLAVIAAITQQRDGTLKRPTDFAGDGRNRLDQRQQLGHIMAVGPGQSDHQRDPLGISYQMVFRALLPPIRRVGARFSPQRRLAPKPNRPRHARSRSGRPAAAC